MRKRDLNLLRVSIGQHDLKTVVRSNFRPEMAEKYAPQFFLVRLDSPNVGGLVAKLLCCYSLSESVVHLATCVRIFSGPGTSFLGRTVKKHPV